MDVLWTEARSRHIRTRSGRYPDATDIEPTWASEAARDPRARVTDPDRRSGFDVVRMVGYTPTAGFVITVIAMRIDDDLWGVTAWKSSGAERRSYLEAE